MANNQNNVGAIRAFFKKTSPKVHAFENHPIYELDEYIAGMYIDMLCMVALYENTDTEKQVYFITRLMAGSKLTDDMNDHIKNAMEITVEKVSEFIKLCKENKLTFAFLIDSMLVACANGTPNKKQTEFIVELADVLGVTKAKMEQLSKLAKVVLEQDSKQYSKVMQEIRSDERQALVDCIIGYLKEFVVGVLVDTDKMLYLYSKNKSKCVIKDFFDEIKVDDGAVFLMDRKSIIFENIEIDVFSEGNYLDGYNGPVIAIQNCSKFLCKNSSLLNTRMRFIACNSAEFVNCLFDGEKLQDCHDIIHISQSNLLTINECEVQNVKIKELGDNFSEPRDCGFIRAGFSRIGYKITIENSCFRNIIRGGNGRYSCCTGLIVNPQDNDDWDGPEIEIKVAKSSFSCCVSSSHMFYHGGKHEVKISDDCTFTGCCPVLEE